MAIILKDVGENKVNVINVYRNLTGVGLKEAKDAIEDIPVVINVADETEAINAFAEVGAIAVREGAYSNQTALESNSEDIDFMANGSYANDVIVPRCNKINPDEVGMLDCNGLIAVLNDIKKLTGAIDKYFNQILSANSEIEKAKNHAEELKNAVSGWVYTTTIILIIVLSIAMLSVLSWFGIVLGIVGGIVIQNNFLKMIDKIKNGKRREEEARDYLAITLPPLQDQIKTSQKNIEVVQQSEEGIWAIDIIGEELFNSESINDLMEIVKSRRADNLKEALNKYDSTQHTNKMEEMQRAIQNASEIAAEESVKQTAYAKETAKSSHQAATAAKATAYHTRKTAYNTRQIDKNTRRFRQK